MSYKWPDKDKDEVVDYSVDWSRFLGTDGISAVTWSIVDENGNKEVVSNTEIVNGLQFLQGTISGQVATARFGLGTNNVRYTVTCKITTSAGLAFERSIFLRIREK